MEKHHCYACKNQSSIKKVLFIQLNIMKNLNDIMKHCVLKKKKKKAKKEEGMRRNEEGVKGKR